MDAEGLVGVERRTGCLGVLGDELEVGEGCHHRDREGDEEGRPCRSADLGRHIPCERIDPCAEDVANDEEQQQFGSHDPLELGLHLTLILGGLDGLTHRVLHHHVRDGNPADDSSLWHRRSALGGLGQRPDRGPQASMRSRSKVRADSTMKSLRGATSLPMSNSKTRWAASMSPIVTRRRVRWRGSMVVSAN